MLEKASQQLYDEWYANLDPVDQELVQSVDVTNDDDYPFVVKAPLSQAAKERGNYYKSEVGWTVMRRPLPPANYYETLKKEQEAKRSAEGHQFEEKFTHHKAEKQRMDAWIQQHLSDYECITGYIKTEEREGERKHFTAGSFGTGVSFYPKRLWEYDIWEEHYGNALRYWVPTPLAELRYRQRWEEDIQRDGENMNALHALAQIIGGLNTFGDDLYKWAQKAFGETALVSMACKDGPVSIEQKTIYALASKYYRIPVKMLDNVSKHVIGYGDASLRRGSMQTNEQWERDNRMHGWVPLGEENNPAYSFPTEADIREGQKRSADYAQFFSDFA